MPASTALAPTVAVVGGGPAGLMAADVLSAAGCRVELFDAMPSVGRKFLLAGIGGLNLTHAEPFDLFVNRYAERSRALAPMLRAFGPDQARGFASALGVATFVGSSGRVFPTDMKAAPLLRAWLQRLRFAGVTFHMRTRWVGWDGDIATRLRFDGVHAASTRTFDAVVLALGGASWPRLGSDGAWQPLLAARQVDLAPLKPANCGFDVGRDDGRGGWAAGWSEHFRSRFAGAPLKNVALTVGTGFHRQGEFVVTATGIEGSLVYAASALLRDRLEMAATAAMTIDLLPGRGADVVRAEIARPRGSRSLATHLKSRLGIDGVKSALLHELLPHDVLADPTHLAAAVKAVPLRAIATRPLDEAISSAGGVRFEALDDGLMLRELPGVFCAGEMLDWEAPTGGYLLTACLASGVSAGQGVLRYLGR